MIEPTEFWKGILGLTRGLLSAVGDGGQDDRIGTALAMMTLDLDRTASSFFRQRIQTLLNSRGKISPANINLDKIDRES
jgi:hypothetical protein